jgi:hypothetical protein
VRPVSNPRPPADQADVARPTDPRAGPDFDVVVQHGPHDPRARGHAATPGNEALVPLRPGQHARGTEPSTAGAEAKTSQAIVPLAGLSGL